MIYFLILFFLFIPVLGYDILGKTRGWKLWYSIELIVLILLVGLRYRVGGDTLDYIVFFEEYPTFSELFYFDFSNAPFNPLWYIYNAIIKSIWNDFLFFQIIQATIVNSIIFWFFKKNTKYFFSAILVYYVVYYLYFNMEVLREILTVCIFLISYRYIKEKKYLKYLFWAVIALLFHYSAMIMFIIPLLLRIPKINWIYTLFAFFSVILLLSLFDITPFLSNLLVGSDALTDKFDAYTSMEGHTLNVNGVLAYVTPIVLLMYANRNNEKTEFAIQSEKLLLLYVLLIGFSIFFPAMFSRMQNYIEPFYIIYIINSIIPYLKNSHNNTRINSYLVKLALAWFLFFNTRSYFIDYSEYMIGARSYNIYYPYHSIFDPVVEVKREKFVEIYKTADIE